MGYLDNSSITVDAILTKRGRELLAANDGSFLITQFALGDDEIDYSLYNENHPNGTQYSGEAIENLQLLEAFPDETNCMRHKLITLPRGTSKLPVVTANISKVTLTIGASTFVSPTTLNFDGTNNSSEPGGYIFTVGDRRLFSSLNSSAAGTDSGGSPVSYAMRPQKSTGYTSTAVSETVIGNTLSFTAISSIALFGTNNQLITTITVEGRDTGARITIPVTINKIITANAQYKAGTTGVEKK